MIEKTFKKVVENYEISRVVDRHMYLFVNLCKQNGGVKHNLQVSFTSVLTSNASGRRLTI